MKSEQDSSAIFRAKFWRVAFAIAAATLVLNGFQIYKYRVDIDQIRSNYIQTQTKEIEALSQNLEQKFQYLYQAARTMSLLPGVKNIDRYGKNFNDDAKMTV